MEENPLKRKIISVILALALLAAMLPQLTLPAAAEGGRPRWDRPIPTSINIPDYEITEGTQGYWDGGVYWYSLYDSPVTLTYPDGREETFKLHELQDYSDVYALLDNDQHTVAPWGPGSHTSQASFSQFDDEGLLVGEITCEFQVQINPSPVERIEIDPVVEWEGECVWRGGYEPDLDDSVYYDAYWARPDEIRVWLKDGSSYAGTVDEVMQKLQAYDDWAFWDDQSLLNRWDLGEHKATLGLFGKTYDYTVQVIENPVANITAEDLVYPAFTNGGPGFRYDENGVLQVDDSWYYYYIDPVFTVTLKTGEVYRGNAWTISGQLGRKSYPTYDLYQGGDSPLTVGSYPVEAIYFGKTAYFTFTIAPGGFIDVREGAFYADAVDWAVQVGVTNGIDDTHFGPARGCTRGQVVTFLWRLAGCPEPKRSSNPFQDVEKGAFYYKAVLWAVEKGITNGTSQTKFSPDATCTRGQIVTFLWRAAGRPAINSAYLPFWDVAWEAYYCDAVLWAVREGITNGKTAYEFGPDDTCTRGQVVTFLYRAEAAIHRFDEEPPIPAWENKRIGISLPTLDLQRWADDGANMKNQLETAGYTVDLQYADNNPRMQIGQIEDMVRNGMNVLIVAAVDGDALRSVLDWVKRAGIIVIAYDRPIYADAVDYYTTFDNFSVGAAQAKFIVDRLDLDNAGGKSYNIEIVGGAPDDGNAYVFYDGAMSVLQKYIDAGALNVVSGQTLFEEVATEAWSYEAAQARFENLLSIFYSDKQLDAVMCSNDSTAQGVALALENVYRNDVYPILTGQDCDIVSMRNILAGKQAMSVFKDTRTLAAKAVEIADAVMKGAEPPVNAIFTTVDGMYSCRACYCDPSICTEDMIQSLLIDSGYYTWEELRGW